MRPMADKPQHPPTLDFDGARLRPLRVADADALYAYLRDPVVTELTSVYSLLRSDWAAAQPVGADEARR